EKAPPKATDEGPHPLRRRCLFPVSPHPALRATFSRKAGEGHPRETPMAPRVLISDKLSPAAVAIFKARGVEVDVKPGLDKDELAKIIGDYDGLAIRSTAKGVIVMNTPFGNSITTAEHAIALMFALARQLPAADASTQAGKWEKNRFMGVELTGKTLGIIGCGNIGSNVASRAIGLRMRVIAYDPFLSAERAAEIG